ncbi:DUF3783 domain-containing protein [Clostridium sp. 19966]|uniref:DUF3783 domain-containing protein n=1 Tax=Clostridium sp. 19966 TaxID=2768166 RepID=UPI0028DF5E17|nr:DUF3783 domain-containing protein [Clostridium sp. 19966]MDT8716748.1 DUF3783 domain-containing protein [Clostridium sp. 19966]
MKNNKCMLIYGFTDDEKEILNAIIKDVKESKLIEISETMTLMTLKDIINGLKIDVVSGSVPDEKVIIFNNYSDEELEATIKAIRTNLKSRPIMAVVTETSINWTFSDLIKHLIEEREWYKSEQNRRE